MRKDGRFNVPQIWKDLLFKNYFSVPSESLQNMRCMLQFLFFSVYWQAANQLYRCIWLPWKQFSIMLSSISVCNHFTNLLQLNIQYIVQRNSLTNNRVIKVKLECQKTPTHIGVWCCKDWITLQWCKLWLALGFNNVMSIYEPAWLYAEYYWMKFNIIT